MVAFARIPGPALNVASTESPLNRVARPANVNGPRKRRSFKCKIDRAIPREIYIYVANPHILAVALDEETVTVAAKIKCSAVLARPATAARSRSGWSAATTAGSRSPVTAAIAAAPHDVARVAFTAALRVFDPDHRGTAIVAWVAH